LVVEYDVVRPSDSISLSIQSSWDAAAKEAKPVLLSGNPGKGKASVPVSLNQSSLKS